MDKDKSSEAHAQGSWVDIHHFIGDLLTSGHASKTHPDVLSAVWGVAAGVGFKPGTLEPSQHEVQQSRPAGRGTREGVSDVPHTCTCPGCPYSNTSTPEQSLPSVSHPDPMCHPKDLSVTAPVSVSPCLSDPIAQSSTSELEMRSSDPAERQDSASRTQGQESSVAPAPSRASSSSLTNFLFPCLCCHSGLHANRKGTDHSHAQQHFHHHHHSLMSCLACPQVAPTPQVSGSCSCCCFTCNQVCHHQHRQAAQRQDKDRTLANPASLYPCMHCSSSFCRPSQLLQHQRSEHVNKPPGFLCSECGRTFNSHSNLRIHLHVHTGARPYSCSDCGKRFSQSGALKIHRRIHTGERPYSCSFCGRGFPHLAGVQAHHRTHTGEKPYRCGQCGKCFSQSGALKNHTRIHTGERPFICSLCGKGFSNHSGIRSHYRTYHAMTSKQSREVGDEPAVRGCSPGRPKTLHPSSVRTNSPENTRHTAQKPAGTSESTAANGTSVPQQKAQAGGGNLCFQRPTLLYECEDCGQRFKEALSRNRHQTLVHYSQKGPQDEQGQEGAPHCEGPG